MTHTHTPLSETFNTSNDNIISLHDLAAMLGRWTSLPRLIKNRTPSEITIQSQTDPDNNDVVERETLKFVPEIYRGEAGAVSLYNDFWLQIHIKGAEGNPVMALKFSDLGNDRYEMSSPHLTTIYDNDELYYRPVLGHEIIESIETLIHKALKRPLKEEPHPPLLPGSHWHPQPK